MDRSAPTYTALINHLKKTQLFIFLIYYLFIYFALYFYYYYYIYTIFMSLLACHVS